VSNCVCALTSLTVTPSNIIGRALGGSCARRVCDTRLQLAPFSGSGLAQWSIRIGRPFSHASCSLAWLAACAALEATGAASATFGATGAALGAARAPTRSARAGRTTYATSSTHAAEAPRAGRAASSTCTDRVGGGLHRANRRGERALSVK